jgi:putative ABC transport system permease protein
MSFMAMCLDLIALALSSVRAHAVRSLLTVLGLVIGVASVLAIFSLSQGLTSKVRSDLAVLSGVTVFVSLDVTRPNTATSPLALDDIRAIRDAVTSASVVIPVSATRASASYQGLIGSATVVGTSADYFQAMHVAPDVGRVFDKDDDAAARPVCVVGQQIAEKLFGSRNALGLTLRINQLHCEIIGVLRKRGRALGADDADDLIAMPIRAYHTRLVGARDLQTILIAVRKGVMAATTSAEITDVLRARRNIPRGIDAGFHTSSSEEAFAQVQHALSITTVVLAAIASISLLVGGIGIMNMMLVSVMERTREIGVRLANGARPVDIKRQFLIEAIVLAVIGAILGTLVGYLLSMGIGYALMIPFALDIRSIALTLGFGCAVGVVFGYIPAARAANLDPVEALRHD